MGDIEIKVDDSSVAALIAVIEEIKTKIDAATRLATEKSAQYLQARAVANFQGAHPVGFHHVGGDKPNTVTGFLQRSIIYSPVVGGNGVYTTTEGPTAIYSRVIELGATITKEEWPYLAWFDAQVKRWVHKKEVVVPPRPYFTPAYESLTTRIIPIFEADLAVALEV